MRVRVGRFLIRHRWAMQVHRWPIHRVKDEACFICACVWAEFLSHPTFVEGLERGRDDFEAGRTFLFNTETGEATPNPAWPKDGPQP